MAKFMKLRRDGECADCQQPTLTGSKAYWFADEWVIRCSDCFAPEASVKDEPAKMLVHATASASVAEQPSGTAAVENDVVQADVAGASAQLEYDKRSARELAKKERRIAEDAEWRAEIKQQKPVVGRLVTALTAKPQMTPESQSTQAWKVGAVGERRVAEVLGGIAGARVMHDRLVPGSRANIDHLAIGPAGVFVIDAKNYTGQVEVRDVGGLLRTDERLYVKNRDRSKLVESMHWHTEVVRKALGEEFADVEVHGVLCFVGCEWGWRMRQKHIKGVTVLWPKALPAHVSVDGDIAGRIDGIADHLGQKLRPAV